MSPIQTRAMRRKAEEASKPIGNSTRTRVNVKQPTEVLQKPIKKELKRKAGKPKKAKPTISKPATDPETVKKSQVKAKSQDTESPALVNVDRTLRTSTINKRLGCVPKRSMSTGDEEKSPVIVRKRGRPRATAKLNPSPKRNTAKFKETNPTFTKPGKDPEVKAKPHKPESSASFSSNPSTSINNKGLPCVPKRSKSFDDGIKAPVSIGKRGRSTVKLLPSAKKRKIAKSTFSKPSKDPETVKNSLTTLPTEVNVNPHETESPLKLSPKLNLSASDIDNGSESTPTMDKSTDDEVIVRKRGRSTTTAKLLPSEKRKTATTKEVKPTFSELAKDSEIVEKSLTSLATEVYVKPLETDFSASLSPNLSTSDINNGSGSVPTMDESTDDEVIVRKRGRPTPNARFLLSEKRKTAKAKEDKPTFSKNPEIIEKSPTTSSVEATLGPQEAESPINLSANLSTSDIDNGSGCVSKSDKSTGDGDNAKVLVRKRNRSTFSKRAKDPEITEKSPTTLPMEVNVKSQEIESPVDLSPNLSTSDIDNGTESTPTTDKSTDDEVFASKRGRSTATANLLPSHKGKTAKTEGDKPTSSKLTKEPETMENSPITSATKIEIQPQETESSVSLSPNLSTSDIDNGSGSTPTMDESTDEEVIVRIRGRSTEIAKRHPSTDNQMSKDENKENAVQEDDYVDADQFIVRRNVKKAGPQRKVLEELPLPDSDDESVEKPWKPKRSRAEDEPIHDMPVLEKEVDPVGFGEAILGQEFVVMAMPTLVRETEMVPPRESPEDNKPLSANPVSSRAAEPSLQSDSSSKSTPISDTPIRPDGKSSTPQGRQLKFDDDDFSSAFEISQEEDLDSYDITTYEEFKANESNYQFREFKHIPDWIANDERFLRALIAMAHFQQHYQTLGPILFPPARSGPTLFPDGYPQPSEDESEAVDNASDEGDLLNSTAISL